MGVWVMRESALVSLPPGCLYGEGGGEGGDTEKIWLIKLKQIILFPSTSNRFTLYNPCIILSLNVEHTINRSPLTSWLVSTVSRMPSGSSWKKIIKNRQFLPMAAANEQLRGDFVLQCVCVCECEKRVCIMHVCDCE